MRSTSLRCLQIAVLIVMVVSVLDLRAQAGTEKVLYKFSGGTDGASPVGQLVFDAEGNAYGVTQTGGTSSCACGTVFELKRESHGWKHIILYSFKGGDDDGSLPSAGVVFDSIGNLYGTTSNGDVNRVYQLKPNGHGKWTESVIYNFDSYQAGCDPVGGLVLDAADNLYGAAHDCGGGFGAIYELQPANGSWNEITLHDFSGIPDGAYPQGGLVFDSGGNLLGTTEDGGAYGPGTVFELTPKNGTWVETIVHDFTGGMDGYFPAASLNLYNGEFFGTTYSGGKYNVGTVFKLIPGKGTWKTSIIRTFRGGNKGGYPEFSPVFFDESGNAYGTTEYGGNHRFGTVYKLSAAKSGERHETVLHSFTEGNDGGYPCCGVVVNNGELFGVSTSFGKGFGVVFEVTP
jgi:uncharacterized repeat protein (TIGR03803 family)